jgi:hypothetical protein
MKKQIFDLRHINTAPIIIYNWFKKIGFKEQLLHD